MTVASAGFPSLVTRGARHQGGNSVTALLRAVLTELGESLTRWVCGLCPRKPDGSNFLRKAYWIR
jgi:hypothetical protein